MYRNASSPQFSLNKGNLWRFIPKRSITNIALIPGDGVGKEVVPAARKVIEAVAPGKFKFTTLEAGFECFMRRKTALPEETLEFLTKNCSAAIFGATQSPIKKIEGYSSPIVQLRKHYNLYANVRPITCDDYRGKPIDMVIVREGTECLYIKSETIETSPDGKVSWAKRKISEAKSRDIGKFALDLAIKRYETRAARDPNSSRPKVTIVHKSNVLAVTDGLFRETIYNLAISDSIYPGIKIEDQIVDSMIYKMVLEPHLFDVIVAPNLYGDIISDCGAALVGSLGLVASANIGKTFCLGEPVHGSAPDIAGKNIANPIAAIRSAALLLEHLKYTNEASKIHAAVEIALKNKEILTPDLKGKGTTKSLTEAICELL